MVDASRRRRAGALLALVLGTALALAAPPSAPTSPASVLVAPRLVSTLTLQPDAANGTDAFVLSATPASNFGDNASLLVGPSGGALRRSLLRFDLSAVPANATILDAVLELFQTAGSTGTVEARRLVAPWTEGDGGGPWSRLTVTVRETEGTPRTLEPVDFALSFPAGSVMDPESDVTLWDGATEVPSQVYGTVLSGGDVIGTRTVFGATVAALSTRTYTLTYGANGSAIPAHRLRTFNPLPLWASPSTGGGSSGATVVDLEGDGRLDVVIGTADGYVRALNDTLQAKWATRLSTTRSVPYTPQVRDLDADGNLDIVVVTNTPGLARLDGNGAIRWQVNLTLQDLSYSTPVLLDVNDDGTLDVLYGGRSALVQALSGIDGTSLLTYAAGDWTYSPSVADANDDGFAEIYFASDDGLIHAYNETGGLPLWENADPGATWPENSVALADVDGDGQLEVVTSDEEQNSPLYALNIEDGSVAWFNGLPTSSWREGGQTLGDLDGDGDLEMFVGIESGVLYALNASNGNVEWSYQDDAFQPLYPALVDVDGDGTLDVVYAEEGQGGLAALRILNRTGALVYRWNFTENDPVLRTLSQFHLISPAVVDLNGDGTLEILVPTGTGLQAFGTGGLARDWRTWGYNWNHTHLAYDGSSPDGAAFLDVSLGAPTTTPALGASWSYRDGVASWAQPGGDFAGLEAAASASPGWVSWNLTTAVQEWYAGTFPNQGVLLLEADEAAGADHVFASSDDVLPAQRPRLRITYDVSALDPVPRITGVIPDLVRLEDSPPFSLNFAGFAADDDTPLSQLRWNVSGYDPAVVSIAGTETPGNHILTFYPQPNAVGSFLVTYWLTDPQGNFATRAARIEIVEVNDAPSFLPPSTFIIRYDTPYRFDFSPYIGDIDDPMSALVLWTDDPSRATPSGFNVTFQYPESLLNQWVFVTLGVSDGQDTVLRVVAVKVTDDQPPVVQSPLPDVTLFEGEFRAGVFDLDDYFRDPDNDTLYFSEGYTHLNVTIHANNSVDMRAESDWFGWERVTFRGADPQGAIAEDTILVNVLPVNDPPTLGPVPDLRVRYDEPYTFDLEAYLADPDTPLWALVITTSSGFVSVAGTNLTLLYPFALNGTVQDLTINVSDGTSLASRTIRVAVGDDRPPVLLGYLSDVSFLEDGRRIGAYNLSVFFSDPDGEPVFFSSGNLNVRVTIDAWGSVDLGAAPNWSGMERVTFRATDSLGALAEDTVLITVIPVNDAPFFLPIPTVYMDATTGFLDLGPYVGDIDTPRENLIFSTPSLAGSIVGEGILFRFPGEGSEDVQIIVFDGQDSNSTTVTVVVNLDVPILQLPPYVYWIPAVAAVASFVGFVTYRWRRIEWAFLVTNPGLLVASISRRESAVLDTDLMTGMLTTIMDFARTSFSDEQERNLEGLSLGEERVAIVRGKVAYLAVVYRGRAPGSLTHIMESLLKFLEAHYADALGDIVDTSRLGAIPQLLERLVHWGWWPLLTFKDRPSPAPPAAA